MRGKQLLRLGALALLATCALSARAEVTVVRPWVRATVAGQSEAGAFMTIKSTEALKLVAASSPVAKRVEVHKMSMEQGMMRMRPVDALDIPANGTVELKPGGFHVMLVGIDKPLTKGEVVPVTLVFQGADGKKISTEVKAEVRALNAAPDGKMTMKMN